MEHPVQDPTAPSSAPDSSCRSTRRRWPTVGAVFALSAAALGVVASSPASSAQPVAPAHSGFQVKVLATGVGGNINPDDIAVLGKDVFVGYQNGVGAMGEPASGTGTTTSTIVEYKKKKVVQTWQITGKCDGMGADASTGEILATVNEDGNSSMYAIHPATKRVVHLTYNVDPISLGGGGTDAVSVINGKILISGSNPSSLTAPAVYSASLDETTGVTTLTSVFADNATATGPSGSVTLGLTDPDSNAVVPSVSPKYAGDFALVSQADAQVIFVNGPGTAGQTLTQLPNSSNTVYQITGTFTPGTIFVDTASDSGVPGTLSTLNLTTGQVTPMVIGFTNPHGLMFI